MDLIGIAIVDLRGPEPASDRRHRNRLCHCTRRHATRNGYIFDLRLREFPSRIDTIARILERLKYLLCLLLFFPTRLARVSAGQ